MIAFDSILFGHARRAMSIFHPRPENPDRVPGRITRFGWKDHTVIIFSAVIHLAFILLIIFHPREDELISDNGDLDMGNRFVRFLLEPPKRAGKPAHEKSVQIPSTLILPLTPMSEGS